MKIYFTDPEKNDTYAVKLFEKYDHKILSEKEKTSAEVIFIRITTHANGKFLQTFPDLKYVLIGAVGMDNIDLYYCKRNKITVINAAKSNANAVAEHTVTLALMLLKRIDFQRQSLSRGDWRDDDYMGEDIAGKTVGIVGCGAIGKLVAEKFKSLGVKEIFGFDPYIKKEEMLESSILKRELEELLSVSDIITLHLPLNAKTKYLISKAELTKMKKSAYLINTSRGGVVDEKALLSALTGQSIAGAALDVFENEPKLNRDLLKVNNLICTPHIAAFSKNARKNMTIEPVETFLKSLRD